MVVNKNRSLLGRRIIMRERRKQTDRSATEKLSRLHKKEKGRSARREKSVPNGKVARRLRGDLNKYFEIRKAMRRIRNTPGGARERGREIE